MTAPIYNAPTTDEIKRDTIFRNLTVRRRDCRRERDRERETERERQRERERE